MCDNPPANTKLEEIITEFTQLVTILSKSTDFTEVTQLDVKRAVKRLNTRPRKTLDFKTPNDLMAEHRAALAA